MAWTSFDPESVRNTSGGIQHGASAVQNLRAMGEDIAHAVVPDRAVELAVLGAALKGGFLWGVLGFLLGAFFDLVELVTLPFMLLKNLIDIIGHGGAAAVNAIEGESDGDAAQADEPPFDLIRMPSVQRQFWDHQQKPAIGLQPPAPSGVTTTKG
jgi:hypothetical protein